MNYFDQKIDVFKYLERLFMPIQNIRNGVDLAHFTKNSKNQLKLETIR